MFQVLVRVVTIIVAMTMVVLYGPMRVIVRVVFAHQQYGSEDQERKRNKR